MDTNQMARFSARPLNRSHSSSVVVVMHCSSSLSSSPCSPWLRGELFRFRLFRRVGLEIDLFLLRVLQQFFDGLFLAHLDVKVGQRAVLRHLLFHLFGALAAL